MAKSPGERFQLTGDFVLWGEKRLPPGFSSRVHFVLVNFFVSIMEKSKAH